MHRNIGYMRCRIGLILIAVSVSAMFAESSDPLARSPFLPPESEMSGASTPGSPLELRTVLAEGRLYAFSVYESSTKTSRWIRLDDTMGVVVARHYNPAKETLTVEYRGRMLLLALKDTSVEFPNLSAGFSNHYPFGEKQPKRITGQTATVALISPSEASRLAKVAEIIQARRGARRQTEVLNQPSNGS